MFLALLAIAVARKPFARYTILVRFWRPDWQVFRRIFRIGLPIAGTMLLEGGFFIAAAFVAGRFGAAVIAAHTIAMQLPHISFMVPMGLAQAATVRVGQAVGRGDAVAAYRSGWIAIAVTLAFMSVMTVIVLAIPHTFASAFMDHDRADSAAVLALATTFLFYAAIFQMATVIQAVTAGALRGLNDTAMPMLLASSASGASAPQSGSRSPFSRACSGSGLWLGFDCGLGSVAALLTLRLRKLTRLRYIPAVARD